MNFIVQIDKSDCHIFKGNKLFMSIYNSNENEYESILEQFGFVLGRWKKADWGYQATATHPSLKKENEND